jgi:hypothetical protein
VCHNGVDFSEFAQPKIKKSAFIGQLLALFMESTTPQSSSHHSINNRKTFYTYRWCGVDDVHFIRIGGAE